MTLRRIPAPQSIEAISQLYDLEVLAEQFTARTGLSPEQPSYWNPKAYFSEQIESWVPPPKRAISLVDYVYSSDVSLDPVVTNRINERPDRGTLLTPSGTTSVVNVCSYLKNIGTNHLVVLAPAYFTVEAVANAFGISVSYVDVCWEKGRYELPVLIDKFKERQSAVWLTFPVYGASVYFSPADISSLIDNLPWQVVVVVDESLAFVDRPSLLKTLTTERVIRICTPHKSLCINGEKVSFVTFSNHLLDGIDAWSDCFSGGIGTAGMRALMFLVDDAFDRAMDSCRALARTSLRKLKGVVSAYETVCMDEDTDGYFVTLYWPSLPAALGKSKTFLNNVLSDSYALPIPSVRNRHPMGCGFCFRVNLFRLDEAGLGGISRLIEAIGRHAARFSDAL